MSAYTGNCVNSTHVCLRFPRYKPHDEKISLFTESYGGKYGPSFVSHFMKMNELIANGTLTGDGLHYLHMDTLGIINGTYLFCRYLSMLITVQVASTRSTKPTHTFLSPGTTRTVSKALLRISITMPCRNYSVLVVSGIRSPNASVWHAKATPASTATSRK